MKYRKCLVLILMYYILFAPTNILPLYLYFILDSIFIYFEKRNKRKFKIILHNICSIFLIYDNSSFEYQMNILYIEISTIMLYMYQLCNFDKIMYMIFVLHWIFFRIFWMFYLIIYFKMFDLHYSLFFLIIKFYLGIYWTLEIFKININSSFSSLILCIPVLLLKNLSMKYYIYTHLFILFNFLNDNTNLILNKFFYICFLLYILPNFNFEYYYLIFGLINTKLSLYLLYILHLNNNDLIINLYLIPFLLLSFYIKKNYKNNILWYFFNSIYLTMNLMMSDRYLWFN